MTRTQNTLRNIVWGFINRIILLLLPFLARTAIIYALGVDYLGLGGLFTSILSILSLAELGISNAIISAMYKPIAEKNTKLVCALMSYFKKAYRIIGIIIFIAGLIIIPFLPKLIDGETPADINLYSLYFIYLGNTVVSYFLFAYKNCIFIVNQRNDINSKIQTVITVIRYSFQILLLLLFKNYYCFAIVIPLSSIITNIVTAILAKKMYPEYITRGEIPQEIKDDLKKRVAGLLLGKISATIRSAIDSIFISAFLGLAISGIYSNYIYIVTSVAGFIQLLEASMIASVGSSITTDTLNKNLDDLNKFTFYLQWIVGWCSICIVCLIQPFMNLWVGPKLMLNNIIAILCGLYLFMNSIGLIRSIYTQALGIWWSLRYVSLIDIFVNFSLNYILGKSYGPYGIILATILDILLVSIPWTTFFLFKDYFGKTRYINYIFSYLKYFLVALFVGSITYYICSIVTIENVYIHFLLLILICIILPNFLYFIIFKKNRYFSSLVSFVLNILKKYSIHFSISKRSKE